MPQRKAGAHTKKQKISGKSVAEHEAHINILELKACQLSLHTFCKTTSNSDVSVYIVVKRAQIQVSGHSQIGNKHFSKKNMRQYLHK